MTNLVNFFIYSYFMIVLLGSMLYSAAYWFVPEWELTFFQSSGLVVTYLIITNWSAMIKEAKSPEGVKLDPFITGICITFITLTLNFVLFLLDGVAQ